MAETVRRSSAAATCLPSAVHDAACCVQEGMLSFEKQLAQMQDHDVTVEQLLVAILRC